MQFFFCSCVLLLLCRSWVFLPPSANWSVGWSALGQFSFSIFIYDIFAAALFVVLRIVRAVVPVLFSFMLCLVGQAAVYASATSVHTIFVVVRDIVAFRVCYILRAFQSQVDISGDFVREFERYAHSYYCALSLLPYCPSTSLRCVISSY